MRPNSLFASTYRCISRCHCVRNRRIIAILIVGESIICSDNRIHVICFHFNWQLHFTVFFFAFLYPLATFTNFTFSCQQLVHVPWTCCLNRRFYFVMRCNRVIVLCTICSNYCIFATLQVRAYSRFASARFIYADTRSGERCVCGCSVVKWFRANCVSDRYQWNFRWFSACICTRRWVIAIRFPPWLTSAAINAVTGWCNLQTVNDTQMHKLINFRHKIVYIQVDRQIERTRETRETCLCVLHYKWEAQKVWLHWRRAISIFTLDFRFDHGVRQ